VWAHHSVHVNFDQSREITVEGVLTEIKWINPHSRFRMDVTSVDGTTMEWLVEMGALNTMKRRGFNMHVFSPGDTVRVIGWPGRRERAVHLNQAFVWDGGEEVCVGARCVRKKVGSGTNKTGVRYK
jgi:hypothetical protein